MLESAVAYFFIHSYRLQILFVIKFMLRTNRFVLIEKKLTNVAFLYVYHITIIVATNKLIVQCKMGLKCIGSVNQIFCRLTPVFKYL